MLEETLSTSIPQRAEVVRPRSVRTSEFPLRQHLKASGVEKLLRGKRLLLVVNDAERPTPTFRVLEALEGALKGCEEVRLLVATGSHPRPTEDQLRTILGECEFSVEVHCCRGSEFFELGATRRGTKLRFNEELLGWDLVLNVNSVEPHYFAGYTGGRKSFLPGLAAYETIEANHKLALDKRARVCCLRGNPVHEDIEEAVAKLARRIRILSLNLVLDASQTIHSAHLGGWKESFYSAVKDCDEIYKVPVSGKADIVVTYANKPFDQTLYQAHKALEHGKLALKEGGAIILVASCERGVGQPEFFELLSRYEEPQELLRDVKKNYVLGYHKAAKIAELASWAKIKLVSRLRPEVVKKCFMQPFSSLEEALGEALKEKGEGSRTLVLEAGAVTVPEVQSENWIHKKHA